MSDIRDWSRIADGNQSQPPDGFPEGTQSPDSVNDSAREIMAGSRRQWEDKEWFDPGDQISYVSASSIEATWREAGHASFYEFNRRVRITGTNTGTIYGRIVDNTNAPIYNIEVDGGLPIQIDSDLKIAFGTTVVGDPISVASVSRLTEELSKAVPVGSIVMWGKGNPPTGWVLCNGQALNTASGYQDLYDVIGLTFGGTGPSNFRVPNFNGRSPIGYGVGSGLSFRGLGRFYGSETHLLTAAQSGLRSHTHQYTFRYAVSGVPLNPNGSYGIGGDALWRSLGYVEESRTSSSNAGLNASQAHNIIHPTIGIVFIIKY